MKTNQTDKATARPWIQESNRRGKVCVTAVGIDERDPLIAEMFDSDFTTLPEQEANAALIVRAVNEYDALKAIESKMLAIASLIGNVDHSLGNGENSAKMRGDLLNDIRTIANLALAAIRKGGAK